MNNEFNDFYRSVDFNGEKSLKWLKLQDVLKLNEHSYPSNQQIFLYYNSTFKSNTSSLARSKWHKMDKMIYIWVVIKYCQMHQKNPLSLEKQDFYVFSSILGVTSSLLEFKWLKLVKPYLKNIPWCQFQDKMIEYLMTTELNRKWTEIALKLFQNGVSKMLRTAKQVRERWVNYIDPNIKRSDWTIDQDNFLLDSIAKLGKKWSQLGKMFKRTQNNIKNRYHSLHSKQVVEKIQNCSNQKKVQEQSFLNQVNEVTSMKHKKSNDTLLQFSSLQLSSETKMAGIRLLDPDRYRCSYREINYHNLNN